MAYQQKEGQGSLFKNDKQNDRQPDFKGTIMIKGVLYNISAWNRTSQNGREYISLQAEEKTADGQSRQPYSTSRPGMPNTAAPTYSAPFPSSYSAPAETIPAPSLEDMPAFGPEEDLPF